MLAAILPPYGEANLIMVVIQNSKWQDKTSLK
jgi:hypothetical protein